MSSNSQYITEPIAIVGSACRFPGDSTTPAKLWELLKNPRDVLQKIPEERFNVDNFYHPDGTHHGTSNVRHSYILSEDHRLFDAQFFGTKPVEAISIDPQQRLLLETVYEGIESAGIPMESLQGSDTGVYVGLMTNDYADLLGRDIQSFPTYFASGTARSILSNRISYFFDWHGPSMTIDTACSSSLIALHQAVQSLRNGECKVAVAAGTNLLLGPEQYVAESKLKMLSPSGRSRMWDKEADGYARGDGIAAVIVKSLATAIADGDHIECIIRETGINQDGRTKGITMPNPVAQAELIRSTYMRAGLDLSQPSDRPQYFEAHGTGTPAGDPVEAEAISTAFFGASSNYSRESPCEPPLFVGSIKTVIGHTEGTAGLAAVLKASLALQNATIPPNMLLNELNPTVAPFYKDLEISLEAQKWPTFSGTLTRRVSVNSFGFGGANAHAILESWDPDCHNNNISADRPSLLPFNFSASSNTSLLSSLAAYSAYLNTNNELNLRNLSYTLNCRRSTLPFRISITAANMENLIDKLQSFSNTPPQTLSPSIQSSLSGKPKILGIFTGQGAQWAGMGADLLTSYPFGKKCIGDLDNALQSLCEQDRPNWSLYSEILKDTTSSRIGEALFSQSLCTAIQILLVDLVHAAGIRFNTVVGHSSGEIAAAYAAGYLSSNDAIKIAYYRGLSLHHADRGSRVRGAMMVAETSFEDAEELCKMPSLQDRICVAASNSSQSVTLSGDVDAVHEAMDIFEDEGKFNRLLKVDKAYHSNHMLPCAAPYVESMQKSQIKPLSISEPQTTWISSVYARDIADVKDSLSDLYWSNNMTKPVLFSQAVSFASGARGPFDMAIEIGPHPALKGPTLQTILEISGQEVPYSGSLARGISGADGVSSMLGTVWSALGSGVINYKQFDSEVTPGRPAPILLKNLPNYQWDHDRIYWHESRASALFRGGSGKFHPLLGTRCPDGTSKEIRWRNYLHTREIPWLAHHQVQGQIVFPAAGYISAATELIADQYGLDSIQIIDFQEIVIGQALTLEENSGTEVIFSFAIISDLDKVVTATFNCYSNSSKGSSSPVLHASARVDIILGSPKSHSLPPVTRDCDSFLDIDAKRFYDHVTDIGFGYTGPFVALSRLRRRMNEAAGTITVPDEDEGNQSLIVHPASLDGAIQSIMLAYSFPGDGRLRSLHLPTRIDRIRLNPTACRLNSRPSASLPFFSSVTDGKFAELSGDVEIQTCDGRYAMLQLEGLHTTPLSPLSAATDIPMFTEITWGLEIPSNSDPAVPPKQASQQSAIFLDIERVALFYLKKLADHTEFAFPISIEHRTLQSYAQDCVSRIKSGANEYVPVEWLNDTEEDISAILNRNFTGSIPVDLEILETIGESIPSLIRGEIEFGEIIKTTELLNRFFKGTYGLDAYLRELGKIACQIGNRFPHINILELGAASSEAATYVVSTTAFSSYTRTNAMEAPFNDAPVEIAGDLAKISFKVLDIAKDIIPQGFSENKYDLIISSLALSGAENIETTLANVRRLLKPGGYLLLIELTDPHVMSFGLVFGCLSGWLRDRNNDGELSPSLSVAKWKYFLDRAGFSGIDICAEKLQHLNSPFTLMFTQAVDDRVRFLRDPLAQSTYSFPAQHLTLIGGKSAHTAGLIANIKEMVLPYFDTVKSYGSLSDLVPGCLPSMGAVLSLTELDEPVFGSITSTELKAFQELFKESKNIIWVGHGAQGSNPFANMFVGIQRTLVTEMDHLRVQFLNLESLAHAREIQIAQVLLKFMAGDHLHPMIQANELLWYTEPELFLKDGQSYIPRLKMNRTRNNRYNSLRRLILKDVDRKEANVAIVSSNQGYQVTECALEPSPFVAQTQVQVTNALLRTVMIGQIYHFFLVTGREIHGGNYVVAFANSLKSCISLDSSRLIHCTRGEDEAAVSMLKIYTHLLAQSAIRRVSPGKAIAVLDPDFSMLSALELYCSQKGVHLVLITSKQSSNPSPWIYLHPQSTRRALRNKIPPHVTHFFDADGSRDTPAVIFESLPKGCEIQSETSLTGGPSGHLPQSSFDELSSTFQASWAAVCEHDFPANNHRLPIHDIKSLIEGRIQSDSQAMVSMRSEKLPVQVVPASKAVKFSIAKTYWLIGLTGGLGISICEWMARQGARYIVISSRKPSLDSRWLDVMNSRGCTIRVLSTDVTNRESVLKSYQEIQDTMPPLGGVAQGAMVLEDTMFFDLDLPRFKNVLRPKVQGAIILDELFCGNTLDFMILFSSMASITGNPGQVAYNAANMFMASLAAQRRSRGFATHAINLGAIVGNGYVTRELNHDQQSYLYRTGHNWMSEQDFHEVFAEGILSCLQGMNDSDPCSSLRIDDDSSKKWYFNPMFQHLVSRVDASIAGDNKKKHGIALKTRLLNPGSQSEVMEILEDALAIKLQSALQTDPGKDIIEMSPDELGVDSLVAVEIRSWFLRELGLDVPVLKIFNVASIQELIEFAFSILPASAIPNIETGTPMPKQLSEEVGVASKEMISATSGENSQDIQKSIPEDDKSFQIHYPLKTETESVVSVDSVLTGDSSSSQTGDRDSSSSSSVEFEESMEEKRKIQRVAPMSMAQTGFWFLSNFVKQKTAFNVTPKFELTGKLRLDDFEKAVQDVVQHHEAIRTFLFVDDDQVPMQGVWNTSHLDFEHKIITHETEADATAHEMAAHIFNLAQGEPIQIKILSLGSDRHWLIFAFHHIIMDGMSFEIFWSDLETAYSGKPLAPVLQYPDFARQQLQEYEAGEYETESKYWKSQFESLPPPIPLLSFSLRPDRPDVVGFDSHTVQLKLEQSFSEEIDACCRRFKVTPFHFHLATWQVFLLRHLQLENICIGLGDGNRTHPDVMQTVGLFLNTLPLQFNTTPSQTFAETLKRTKTISQNAFANSRMPFDAILNELSVPRSASHNPLFQAFFNFRQGLEVSREFCGCKAEASLIAPGATSYDLQLDVSTLGPVDTSVYLLVQKDLYSASHAEILLRGYERLLRDFCRNPATRLSWSKVYSEVDIEQSLKIGKGPELKDPCPLTVVHRLDTVVTDYPGMVAIQESSGLKMTYTAFQRGIFGIAKRMLKHGICPGARVAVLLSPSSNWVCTLFAILRIGAIYIPLDRKLGLPRLADIVHDSNPRAIIIDATTAIDFAGLATEVQGIDITHAPIGPGEYLPNLAAPEDIAIIMYTSGSTGKPKGIAIRHSSFIHHIQSFCHVWKIRDASETILHQSSYAWDMSIYQLFISACIGAKLVIADSQMRGDPIAISQLISSTGVTMTFATPTEYLTWLRYGKQSLIGSKFKMAVSGGEFIPLSLLREFESVKKEDLRLVNVYGPAETTLSCSSAEVFYMRESHALDNTLFNLHALPNYSISVVDHNMDPVPLGIPGEILVGGLGIAKGYLDLHETEDRFFVDPHASAYFKDKEWTMLHRTGDRGVLTQENGLILLGRISGDNQIKLNGIRINVEDIERAILKTSDGSVSQVVVSARQSESESGNRQPFLVAFVVMNNIDADTTIFLEGLLRRLPLPAFMHPVALVPIDSLPHNASFKVDRLAVDKLPLPESVSSPTLSNDSSPLESVLYQLWKDVVPKDVFSLYSIRPESDFFHVGGSSLLLVALQSLITKKLGFSVPLHHLFEASTLRGMAKRLQKLTSDSPDSAVDWETEIRDLLTAIPTPEISENEVHMAPSGTSVVVLTGATGFVGGEILRQLIESDRVHLIYCIAVRKPKDDLPPAFKDKKVRVYNGDLGMPRLGLSTIDATMIFGHADIVIHNGADVSFMKTYQSLKLTNIASTVELIKLALRRRIPFHFVSSASVTRLASLSSFPEISVSQYPPPRLTQDGYTAMKWVTEVFLEHISRQFRLKVCIHRPSSVTGTGAPELDLMRNIIEYCQKTRSIPDLSSWSGTFDMVSVESVGGEIMNAVLASGQSTSTTKEGEVRYIHECGETQLATDEIKSFMERQTGGELKELPLGDWVGYAEKAGMSSLVCLYLRNNSNGQTLLPRLTKERN